MLCVPARTRLLPSSLTLIRHNKPTLISTRRTCTRTHLHHNKITMSVQPPQIIEHIVLFKVKPDTHPTKISSMVNGLNALTSLNLTLHLTAGQLLRSRSSSLTFTHMLHSRYKTKNMLHEYAVHPEHVRVVSEHVKPIVDDIMAVDWVSDGVGGDGCLKGGSAMRVSFIKMKEGLGGSERGRVLEVIGGIRDGFDGIEELSVGENFSERAKGYEIGSVAVLGSVEDLEKLDLDVEKVRLEKEKVKEFIESVVVVDYVVPLVPQAASL